MNRTSTGTKEAMEIVEWLQIHWPQYVSVAKKAIAAQKLMTECPLCFSEGGIRMARSGHGILCPLCDGKGEVPDAVAEQYRQHLEDARTDAQVDRFFDNDR